MARKPTKLLIAMLCLLATSCSGAPTPFTGEVLRIPTACIPAPPSTKSFLFTVGSISVQDGSVLSDVTISVEATTGYDGDVTLAIPDSEEFTGGMGVEYDDALQLTSLPDTVTGPGEFWIALTVELFPSDDEVQFSEVEFTIDEERFVSLDSFTLDVKQGGC